MPFNYEGWFHPDLHFFAPCMIINCDTFCNFVLSLK
jgi:hypothetical protein